MAIEQKRHLTEGKADSAKGIQAIDGSLLLRSDIEPIDGRSKDHHVGALEGLDHIAHFVLLRANPLVAKAVLAAQATGDSLTRHGNDLNNVTLLARGLGKCLDHDVGIGSLARAAA